jgi:polysaccharide export outer membrane protein
MHVNVIQKLGLAAILSLMPFIAQLSGGAKGETPSKDRGYILGPGDQISVFVADLPDEFADKTFRIDSAGDVSLPVIGHLHATGLTTTGLEAEAKTRLVHVLNRPDVSITLAAFGSMSVSVLGAVNAPGVRLIDSPKSLFEMLSASGGLAPDAGYYVKVTRNLSQGRIPLADSTVDLPGKVSVATIKLKDILNSTSSSENITIMPGDTIAVPKADIVYAVGSVMKPGGFPLYEHESLTALQIISLAQGLQKSAASDKAKILRIVPGSTNRTEIAVNLKQLMAGKGSDVTVYANDILFVPNSAGKSAGYRAIDAIVAAATGVAVYGRY